MRRISLLLVATVLLLGMFRAGYAAIEAWVTTPASNTSVDSVSIAEGMSPGNVNDAMREILAQVARFAKQQTSAKFGHDSGSADAYVIAPNIVVSSLISGQVFRFKANAANTTITPTLNVSGIGATTIVKRAGVSLGVGDIANGMMAEVVYNGSAFELLNPANISSSDLSDTTGLVKTGRHTIWIPGSAMISRTSSGAAITSVELSSNNVMLSGLGFEGNLWDEFAQFQIGMPTSWDEGSIGAIPYWSAQTGSGTVQWYVQCTPFGDSDALDAAFGTAAGITDTVLTLGDLHIASEISPITISSPAENDMIACQVYRDASEDTSTADAELLGLKIIYVVDESNDT